MGTLCMNTPIKFKKRDERCTSAIIRGTRRSIAVRAIHEADGWRIDHTTALYESWCPWESIDQTRYRNVTEAKRAIKSWLATQ